MNEEYTTEECLQAYYDSLEEQLAEKEAMIDWMALELSKMGNKIPFYCPPGVSYKPVMECVAEHGSCANCWIKASQKAVKKND